jgi:hypothetical protein
LAVGDDRAQLWFLRSRPRRRLQAGALIEFVLRAQIFKQRANLGILSTFPKKRFQLSAGVWKERLINEIDGGGGAFDVEKNDANLRFVGQGHASYLAAVCGGMYLGPRQTGS